MTGTLELKGMSFKAYHGCLESERREGNTFLVDFSCTIDLKFRPASDMKCGDMVSDRLEDTVDYSEIYAVISREMAVPSNLLENVAFRIKTAIQREFPGLSGIKVSVSKKNPPVGGPVEWSTITL